MDPLFIEFMWHKYQSCVSREICLRLTGREKCENLIYRIYECFFLPQENSLSGSQGEDTVWSNSGKTVQAVITQICSSPRFLGSVTLSLRSLFSSLSGALSGLTVRSSAAAAGRCFQHKTLKIRSARWLTSVTGLSQGFLFIQSVWTRWAECLCRLCVC